jgi:hypothetical protein
MSFRKGTLTPFPLFPATVDALIKAGAHQDPLAAD